MAEPKPNKRFKFGDYSFDSRTYVLRSGAKELKLTRQNKAVLHLLIENQQGPMPGDVIYERVWKNPYDESRHQQNVYSALHEIRKAMGDKEVIRSIPGGWILVPHVEAAELEEGIAEESRPQEELRVVLAEMPSYASGIAVRVEPARECPEFR